MFLDFTHTTPLCALLLPPSAVLYKCLTLLEHLGIQQDTLSKLKFKLKMESDGLLFQMQTLLESTLKQVLPTMFQASQLLLFQRHQSISVGALSAWTQTMGIPQSPTTRFNGIRVALSTPGLTILKSPPLTLQSQDSLLEKLTASRYKQTTSMDQDLSLQQQPQI